MATMTFLANFDGDLTWEDSGAGGTFAGSGHTFDTGFFAGHQGVVVDGSDTVLATFTDSAAMQARLPTDVGAVAVRFRNDSTLTNHQQIFNAGQTGANVDRLGLSLANTNGRVAVYWSGNSSATTTLVSDSQPGLGPLGQNHIAYIDFSGTAMGLRVDAEAYRTVLRSAPSAAYGALQLAIGYYQTSPNYRLGGLIDCIAWFDAPLTESEQDVLFARTVPWAFGMSLEPPPENFPPVVDAGADAGATTTTLWTQAGSFTDDDGASTSWTATVDYGDGGGAVPLTLSGQTFSLSHAYSTTGTYTVTVNVTDDGGSVGSDTVQVTVIEGLLTGGFTVSPVAGTHPTAPRITLS